MIPGKDVDLLTGATLDYTESQGLVIRNPNRPAAPNVEGSDRATTSCRREMRELVADEVNPALATHGGFVTYVGHDGEGTAYMTMGGGCHGCSMSRMTMLDGVQTMLSETIPDVNAVKDLTDHSTGENPYYICSRPRHPNRCGVLMTVRSGIHAIGSAGHRAASNCRAAMPAWSRPSAARISSGVPAWGMNRVGRPSVRVTAPG